MGAGPSSLLPKLIHYRHNVKQTDQYQTNKVHMLLLTAMDYYYMHLQQVHNRVESGSDDPDNLDHFFGGSSGSHLQTT